MQLSFDAATLRPLVAAVVEETLSKRPDTILPANRIAFPEREAASLLGLAKHVLRDARLRGEISGTRRGKQVIYTREALEQFAAGK